MKLHRKLAARAKRGGLLADEGIFVDNSIGTLMDLGQLFSQWCKLDQAMQACEDALEAMRNNMSVHGITPLRQETLADILTAKGEMHNEQYERQGRGPDKSNAWLHRHSGRRRSPSSEPSEHKWMGWRSISQLGLSPTIL